MLNIKKKNLKVIFQDKPSGLADAILRTEKYVKKDNFCVILPDDLIIGANCTKELINIYNKKKSTVMGIMEVDKKDVSSYGIIESKIFKRNMYKIENMVEKPLAEDAPSNLAIVGRYILLNDIYKYIKKTKIGKGGELQITDAIFLSSKFNEIWGYKFSGKRYDCGNKIGFLKAQIAVAFKNKKIKNEIEEFINDLGGYL